MTNPTNHLCLNGRRCTPGDDPVITEKPNTLCDRCTARARRHIEALPTQHLALHAMIGEHTNHHDSRRQQPESTVPLNTAVDTLLHAIHHHTTLAAEIVADSLHTSNPYKHQPTVHVHLCCRLVAPHLAVLLDRGTVDIMEWNRAGTHHYVTITTGTQIVQQLEHLAALAHYTLGLTRTRSYRDVPCARCGAINVGRWAGADNYDCENCGTQWPESDIRRQDRILLERHRRGLLHAG